MMDCPKCGEEMVLRVNIGITLPSKYTYKISKDVIRKKECKITHADWPNASLTCYSCKYREKGI